MLEDTIDHISDEIFDGIQKLFEANERQFSFDMRVLGQVATSARCLSSIGLSNAENVAESRTSGLEIQLRGLGQIGLV